MNDFVHFHGALSHAQTMKILSSSDIYVQHSVTARNGDMEGQGVTLAEAGYFGLPVVTTAHNGFKDVVIDKETGYLVPEHDIQQMAEKILLLIQNDNLRNKMGQQARMHISKNFMIDKEVSKTLALFHSILGT